MKQLIAALLTVAIIIASPMPLFSAKGKIVSKPLVKKSTSKPLQETDRLIVKYKKSSTLSSIKGDYISKKVMKGKAVDLKLKPGENSEEIIEKLENDPNVEYVEPNYIRKVTLTPNDTYYYLQWGLEKIKAPTGWAYETGGSNEVTIAVVDTGVDLNHPDLSAKVVAGKDIVNNDNNAQDDHGHGTHVAGIAAASTNNSRGVAGVSWEAKIMPIKVLDSDGSGYDSWVAQGIREAVDRGADVINLSLGGAGYSATLKSATDYAYANNVLVVAAAGNSGDSTPLYPASNPYVMGVGATNENDKRAYFSTYNSSVDISAPGEMIASTYWYYGSHVYAYLSGTSMATPHIAGLAALVKSKWPGYSASQIASRIQTFADDLGPYGRDDYYGYGRINLADTLNPNASKFDIRYRKKLLIKQRTVLNGYLKPAQGGRTVNVYNKPAGQRSWSYYKSTTTTASGYFAAGLKPSRNTAYKIHSPSYGSLTGVSKLFSVKVKPQVSFRLIKVRSRKDKRVRIKIVGTLKPRRSAGFVAIKMVIGGRWRIAKRARVRAGRFSAYLNKTGLVRIRVLSANNSKFSSYLSKEKRIRL